jgi:glycosyltransferase involved in cell wall biosynthesis
MGFSSLIQRLHPLSRGVKNGNPTKGNRPLNVYMMELWSFIPYYVARLCISLKSESVRVTLGSVRYHLDRDYFRRMGLKPDPMLLDRGGTIANQLLRRVFKSFEYLTNLVFLAVRFLVSKPDILHVQYAPFFERGFPFELWFFRWVRHFKIPIVYTVHNVTPQDAPDRRKPLLLQAYHMADLLICHGDQARNQLVQEFGIAAEKIRTIPHGPLFEDQPRMSAEEARTKLGLPVEEPLVLSLGVISPYKGVPFLLDAWKLVMQSGVRGRLLIAGTGDPELLASIRKKVCSDGLASSVELRLEFIPVEELPLLHQAADILVYPYKAGTTSGALLTGMNYGKPIVATALPFFAEHLIDGQEAFLREYGNVKDMAQALIELIEDPRKREVLGRGIAKRTCIRASWSTIARSTIECYGSVSLAPEIKLGSAHMKYD